MAQRTIEEIQASILTKKNETASLNALEVLTTNEKQTIGDITSGSKVSIWRLWVYIMSFVVWLHEAVFETHKTEIEELIALNKIHTARWYKSKALLFQFGFDLFGETDYYDNTNVDEALVLDSLIIKQASVQEIAGRLKLKVAKESSEGILEPLSTIEQNAFRQYMQLVKDAGTFIEIISRDPDTLKLELDIYFNPLVLNSNGERLDGTNNTPVLDAIKEFLYNLEFNGELILTKLTDFLQGVEGVEMPVISLAQAKFGLNVYSDIDETYIADSGYMLLNETDTIINYIAREQLQ